jgi:hypothetical protein
VCVCVCACVCDLLLPRQSSVVAGSCENTVIQAISNAVHYIHPCVCVCVCVCSHPHLLRHALHEGRSCCDRHYGIRFALLLGVTLLLLIMLLLLMGDFSALATAIGWDSMMLLDCCVRVCVCMCMYVCVQACTCADACVRVCCVSVRVCVHARIRANACVFLGRILNNTSTTTILA